MPVKWTKAKKLKFLGDAPVARIATVSKHGRPQLTPVCHVVHQGKIYWATDPDATKLANIVHHRWVAVEYDIYKADWRKMGGVMAQGKARLIRGGAGFRKIRGLLYRKNRYPALTRRANTNAALRAGAAQGDRFHPKRMF